MKKYNLLFASFFAGISLFSNETLPAPYTQLEKILPFEISWKAGAATEKFSDFEHAPFLENLLRDVNAKVVIELGAHLGGSAIYIAQCLPDEGRLYSVDHWDGSAELWDAPPYKKVALSPQKTAYTHFLSNMIHAKVASKVYPVRMTTQEAVKYFIANHIIPDLVYVDAGHDEASVYQDIQAYFPLIKGHGIICGDDWNFYGKTVEKAVRRYAEENDLSIWVSPTNGRLWVLHEQ